MEAPELFRMNHRLIRLPLVSRHAGMGEEKIGEMLMKNLIEKLDVALRRTKSLLWPIKGGVWLRLALLFFLAGTFGSSFPGIPGSRGGSAPATKEAAKEEPIEYAATENTEGSSESGDEFKKKLKERFPGMFKGGKDPIRQAKAAFSKLTTLYNESRTTFWFDCIGVDCLWYLVYGFGDLGDIAISNHACQSIINRRGEHQEKLGILPGAWKFDVSFEPHYLFYSSFYSFSSMAG